MTLVSYRESLHDARSTIYKVLSFFGKCTEVNILWFRAEWLVDWCSNE